MGQSRERVLMLSIPVPAERPSLPGDTEVACLCSQHKPAQPGDASEAAERESQTAPLAHPVQDLPMQNHPPHHLHPEDKLGEPRV